MTSNCSTCEYAQTNGTNYACCKKADEIKDRPDGYEGDYYLAVKPFFYFRTHKTSHCQSFLAENNPTLHTSRIR